MANLALVIGCDAYPNLPHGDLRGAVRDALSFREWVLDRGGGQVAPPDLIFLASPSSGGASIPADVEAQPATVRNVAYAMKDLVSERSGNRLYVYYAGHGCTTDPTNAWLGLDVLALTDFDPISAGSGCVGVEELALKLSLGNFAQVVTFVDACRNFPFQQAFRPAGIGFDPPPGNRARAGRYLARAALIGATAAGSACADGIRGDFTQALLAGLAGDGAAKIYTEDADPAAPYQVRWVRLSEYITGRLPKQTPEATGPGELVLTTFPDGYFDKVQLDISIIEAQVPAAAMAAVNIEILDLASSDNPVLNFPGPGPLTAHVAPRRHRITARTGEYVAVQSPAAYVDTVVQLTLKRSIMLQDGITRGDERPGGISVLCQDQAAVITLFNATEVLLATSVGSFHLRLVPGSYRAVRVDGVGPDQSRGFDVESGLTRSVRFDAPAPVSRGILLASQTGVGPVRADAGFAVLARRDDSAIVSYAGQAFTIPVLPDAVTTVGIADGVLEVRIYDQPLLDNPTWTTLLDRAQQLMSSGRLDPALAVLRSLTELSTHGSPVGRILDSAFTDRSDPRLAQFAPPEQAHRLIGRGPWTVLLRD
jgi:hypothetical protein